MGAQNTASQARASAYLAYFASFISGALCFYLAQYMWGLHRGEQKGQVETNEGEGRDEDFESTKTGESQPIDDATTTATNNSQSELKGAISSAYAKL